MTVSTSTLSAGHKEVVKKLAGEIEFESSFASFRGQFSFQEGVTTDTLQAYTTADGNPSFALTMATRVVEAASRVDNAPFGKAGTAAEQETVLKFARRVLLEKHGAAWNEVLFGAKRQQDISPINREVLRRACLKTLGR